ncbi:sigma-54-dependent transcriptional regulator [Ectobacillus ponti]|uniref:Sigma-54 dependent transcriptional regulator n=1 Tax=Ectobacillus ponti TaxID=2961894 RepID=A0AA41XDJ1_9BACI|nr:sigma-54 dependent transcriptional regulator [Ectobacillus ponti]MCP8970913.1 sigma-54 dependent transcriptional regulator [Ectobacillus ponti]
MMYRVLLVDDEAMLCKYIEKKLKKSNLAVEIAHTVQQALAILQRTPIDAAVIDYMLPDGTGMELLKEMQARHMPIKAIMLTAFGNVETAVQAMKLGAFDYMTKPADLDVLRDMVVNACSHGKAARMRDPEAEESGFVFQSPAMKQLQDMMLQIKDTAANVLILGESGSGKTALAKWIHETSNRKKREFVAVNCAAIPEALLESELFGHQKGAFTGATDSRAGKFEKANGGTIFLDEIGEMPVAMQAKLLHVIEEKCFARLGSNQLQTVDVRILAATNKNLAESVRQGLFREDLYYRLNVVEVTIPPLRERREDIPFLVAKQLRTLNEKYGRTIGMQQEALVLLMEQRWKGNVRELLNVLERVHILKREGLISSHDVLAHLPAAGHQPIPSGSSVSLDGKLSYILEDVEKKMIERALLQANGNQTKAAELLGISRHTLIYKMKKFASAE